MAKLTDVTIYNTQAPGNKETLPGRVEGPWFIVNTGRHTKWGVYDAKTGMKLFHAAPTLATALAVVDEINAAGLALEPKSSWDGVQFGDATAYTSESIRAISLIVRPHVNVWTGRK